MARKKHQQDILDRENNLRGFDALLSTTSGLKVDEIFTFMVEKDIPLRARLPKYEALLQNGARKYLDHSWDLPARHAFLSVNTPKPYFTTMSHIAASQPNCWEWKSVSECFQPSVWAGALLLRGDTARDPNLPQVLSQALRGANTPQDRHDRVVSVLGGGFHHAMDLLTDWGASAWTSTETYGGIFHSLLSALLDKEKEEAEPGVWSRWSQAMQSLAHNKEEIEAWKQGVMRRVIQAMPALFRLSGNKHGCSINQSALQLKGDLIALLCHTEAQPQHWSDDVLNAVADSTVELIENESRRGPSRINSLNAVLGQAYFKLLEDRPLPQGIYKAAAAYPFDEDNLKNIPGGPDFTQRLKVLALTHLFPVKDPWVQPKPKM